MKHTMNKNRAEREKKVLVEGKRGIELYEGKKN